MERITEVTRNVLDALIQLRRIDESSLPAPAVLHQRLRSLIDAMFTRASQAGFGRNDANDVAYAVVALADEIVLAKSEALREVWASQSLQLHYFHENVAGEGFFTRLQGLRRDPRRREILQVYYLALLLGFQGRYQVRGGELELLRLVEELQGELDAGRRFDAETLSPSGDRPEDARRAAGRRSVVPWIAAGALAVLALLYAGLHFASGVAAEAVVSRVDAAQLK